MYSLKSIHNKLLIVAIIIFALSLIVIIVLALTSNNRNLTAQYPINVNFVGTAKDSYGYNQQINIDKEALISTPNLKAITSNAQFEVFSNTFRINGIAYLELLEDQIANINNSNYILTKGKYLINTNPVNINVLSGKASISNVVAKTGESLNLEVDVYKITNTEEDLIFNDNKFSDIYSTALKFNQTITEVSSLLIARNNNFSNRLANNNFSNRRQVSNEENIDEACESSLLNILILCRINNYRSENNLNIIEINEQLNELSLSHAVWMQTNESTSTIESNGLSFKERCFINGIECTAEINLKINIQDPESIVTQLLNNKNIIDKDISLMGIGIAGDYLSLLVR